MSETSDVNPLPPGWDAKYDSRTGKRYFINYFTRHTSLEDPRISYRQQQQQQYESIPLHEMNSLSRPSPLSGRSIVGTGGPTMGAPALQYQQAKLAAQETSLEESVAKISALFPTVGETHIKTLLLKYHNREAVVMSALQVEHNPITMPGPYTPPLGARSFPGVGLYALHMTPPNTPRASPLLANRAPFLGTAFCNASPRPHSPKMKLRYLKSVFPVVEETLLLDTLCNADNNVHRATERLLLMGFDKRDTPPPRVSLKKRDEHDSPPPPSPPPHPPPPRMRSVEEKQQMKQRLQEKNPSIPERVVSIALDSVDYDETKAAQILEMMQNDDKKRSKSPLPEKIISEPEVESKAVPVLEVSTPTPSTAPVSPPLPHAGNNNRRHKGKNENECQKMYKEVSPTDHNCHSPLLMQPQGANPDLPKGPNNDILLPDYATWNGPNKELARGPDKSLLGSRVIAKGPDKTLRKGPIRGLAKGSIYSRLTKEAASHNESRGK
ncbi:uncharacterized protein LOC142329190 [Lycorma delicatula]|uniref:uncharacterized protein LOC142329190 n=1 Tax=Lycorma delicatula TaxID=130591 RepID=UPI003F51194E